MSRKGSRHCRRSPRCGPKPWESHCGADGNGGDDSSWAAVREVADEKLASKPVSDPVHPSGSIDSAYGVDRGRNVVCNHVIKVECGDALGCACACRTPMVKQKNVVSSLVQCPHKGPVLEGIH